MKKRKWSYYKYLKSLLTTPDPLRKKKLHVRQADYCGLLAYAKEKGVNVSELSLEEKEQFIKLRAKVLRAERERIRRAETLSVSEARKRISERLNV